MVFLLATARRAMICYDTYDSLRQELDVTTAGDSQLRNLEFILITTTAEIRIKEQKVWTKWYTYLFLFVHIPINSDFFYAYLFALFVLCHVVFHSDIWIILCVIRDFFEFFDELHRECLRFDSVSYN